VIADIVHEKQISQKDSGREKSLGSKLRPELYLQILCMRNKSPRKTADMEKSLGSKLRPVHETLLQILCMRSKCPRKDSGREKSL
jgi:hypothetical protein